MSRPVTEFAGGAVERVTPAPPAGAWSPIPGL